MKKRRRNLGFTPGEHAERAQGIAFSAEEAAKYSESMSYSGECKAAFEHLNAAHRYGGRLTAEIQGADREMVRLRSMADDSLQKARGAFWRSCVRRR